jgi:hypothetical protein
MGKGAHARTAWGLLARRGIKVAACNRSVYSNPLFDRPPFAFFNLLTS